MPKGYLIAHIKVHDKERFAEFSAMSTPVISEYGGKVLVRSPTPEVKEGRDRGISIVIEFESIKSAQKFYESKKYTEAKAIRELASEAELILVEGV